MKMKRKHLTAIIAVIALAAAANANLWAQEGKSSYFSITPAASFAWYPYASIIEESTKTDLDINNFGISAILGIKLFDTVGASLNLTIDDPNFRKLVDIAGHINAKAFMLNFNYHSFGGTVTWNDSGLYNPIPGERYDFRTTWTNVSLLYNFSEAFNVIAPYTIAFGLSYTSFSMPVEYRVRSNTQNALTHPGFGSLSGNVFGISIFIDSLVKAMETDPKKYYAMKFMDLDLWIYSDFIFGIGSANVDKNAVSRMAAANGVASINTGDMSSMFIRYSQIVGFQKVWAPSKNTRIGLAVGADVLWEWITTTSVANADKLGIEIDYMSFSVGPVVRLSVRF